jgi:hypothetical protein
LQRLFKEEKKEVVFEFKTTNEKKEFKEQLQFANSVLSNLKLKNNV